MRLQAIGVVEKPPLPYEEVKAEFTPAAKEVFSATDLGTVDHYRREELRPGARFSGPALVFQMDCTSYVANGWEARVDGYQNLIMERLA